MTIRQISLNDFRNLKSSTLEFHDRLNIFTGSNASGKSSLLEAIHLICNGKSFRTRNLSSCIQFDKSGFLIFAIFDNYKAGFSYIKHKTTIRIDNENIYRISDLAKRTPVKSIDSSSLDLILGGPKDRRAFIDWCLFHVEHNFISLSIEYKHALKQRNALLKRKANIKEIIYWNKFLANYAEEIFLLRSKYITHIQSLFKKEFSDFLDILNIELNYAPGWDTDKNFLDILMSQNTNDIKYGFTRFGIHRDDITITSDSVPVRDVLSRGQIKLISILLIFSQILLINLKTEKKVIVLIDDLNSELDSKAIDLIFKKLEKFNIQIFISNINSNIDALKHKEEYKLFHVEHGMIKTVTKTRENNVRI